MNRGRGVVAGLLAAALAVWIGHREAQTQRALDELGQLVREQGAQLTSIQRSQALQANLAFGWQRALVNERRAADARPPANAPSAAQVPPAAADDRTPEKPAVSEQKAAEALEQTRVLVGRSLASGRWTEEDRLELGRRLWMLPHADAQPLLDQLMTAINAGKLDLRTPGIF